MRFICYKNYEDRDFKQTQRQIFSMVQRILRPGVYAPLPTFFDDDQEVDYVSYKKHLLSKNLADSIQN